MKWRFSTPWCKGLRRACNAPRSLAASAAAAAAMFSWGGGWARSNSTIASPRTQAKRYKAMALFGLQDGLHVTHLQITQGGSQRRPHKPKCFKATPKALFGASLAHVPATCPGHGHLSCVSTSCWNPNNGRCSLQRYRQLHGREQRAANGLANYFGNRNVIFFA